MGVCPTCLAWSVLYGLSVLGCGGGLSYRPAWSVLYGLSVSGCGVGLSYLSCMVCPIWSVCLFQAAVWVCPTCLAWSVLYGLSVLGCGGGLSYRPAWSVLYGLSVSGCGVGLSYLSCMVCPIWCVCFRLRCGSVLPVLYGMSYMVCLFQAVVWVCPTCPVWYVLYGLSVSGCGVGLSYLSCMVCPIWSVCFRLWCGSVLPVLYGMSYMVCLFQAAVWVCPTCPVWYVLYGLSVSGCGVGLSYLSCMVCVQHYFTRRRALASGITMTGFSISTLVLPPFTRWLLDLYGWRGALMILAGIHIEGIFLSALLRPLPSQMRPRNPPPTKHREGHLVAHLCRQLFDVSLLKDLRFMLYGAGTLCSAIGIVTFLNHFVNRALSVDIEKYHATYLMSIYGITSCVFRVVFGFVGNMHFVNRTIMYGVGIFSAGAVSCLSCFAWDFPSFTIASSLLGVCAGEWSRDL